MFRLRGSRVKNLNPQADYPERRVILWGGGGLQKRTEFSTECRSVLIVRKGTLHLLNTVATTCTICFNLTRFCPHVVQMYCL
jgi:hypothetical protein